MKYKFYGAFGTADKAKTRASRLKDAKIKTSMVRGQKRWIVYQENPHIAIVGNPKKKRGRRMTGSEVRPRVTVSRKRKTGKLRPSSPLKGYRINPKGYYVYVKGGQWHIVKRVPKGITPFSGPHRTAREAKDSIQNYYNRMSNPPSKPMYGKITEIWGVKTSGEYKGELFQHVFKDGVKAYPLEDGSVLLKGNKPIWEKS